MFMEFELNQQEIVMLQALDYEFSSRITELHNQHAEQKDTEVISAMEIQLNDEYRKKSSAIRQKARARSLEYFTNHITELIKALQDETTSRVITMLTLEKEDKIPRPLDMWKKNTAQSLSQYLELLNDTERKNMIKFIDYLFDHREEVKERNTPAISFTTSRPKKFIMPNTKASNQAFRKSNPTFYDGMQALALEGKKSRNEITAYMSLGYNNTRDIGLMICEPYESKMLTPFDKSVHDAIVTHYIDGENQGITTRMIFQVISGTDVKRMTPEWEKSINESIDRLFHSVIEINATEQAKAYRLNIDKLHYKGHVLDCRIITAKINGQVTKCVQVLTTPILYEYADKIGQVIRTDLRMLNVPALNNTPENAVLKNYLLQQINIMQYNEKYSRTINYGTIYKLLDIQAENEVAIRKKKKQIRDKVKICLDFWKDEELITGYIENKKRNNIDSVTLQIPSREKQLPQNR